MMVLSLLCVVCSPLVLPAVLGEHAHSGLMVLELFSEQLSKIRSMRLSFLMQAKINAAINV